MFSKFKVLLFAVAVISSLASVSASATGQCGGHGGGHHHNPPPPPCEIDVADIIIDLARVEIASDSGVKFQSVTGLIGLRAMVESGLRIRPLSEPSRKVRKIDLVIDEVDDGFILDTAGNIHPLILSARQRYDGIRVRLQAKIDMDANKSYRLKLDEFPELRKFRDYGCRMRNTLRGTLNEEGKPTPPPSNEP